MTVLVLVLKRFRQSLHLKGMDLCLAPVWTFKDPHQMQQIPLGQNCSMNHASAVLSSGNILNSWTKEMLSLKCLPGAFIAISF